MEQRLVEVRDALRFSELRAQQLAAERGAATESVEELQRQARSYADGRRRTTHRE